MKIIELILDENLEFNGVDAISIVENPAIQSNFVALKDEQIRLAELNKEKRLLLGPVLIPNKPILRNGDQEDYYIYFSKDTVEKASQMYLKEGNQHNASLEHEYSLKGLTLVESWIVNDEVHDKSRLYDNTKDVPVGTWMGAIRVDSDEVWDNYVKEGVVKGFSIEGYFADRADSPNEAINDLLAEQQLSDIKNLLVELETKVIDDNFAIIDDRLAYSTEDKALLVASNIGCEGVHEHEVEGKTWYMPCEQHELKKPCTPGYEMYGWKMKNGRKVPNCIPQK